MLTAIRSHSLGLALAGTVALTFAMHVHAEAFLDLGVNVSRIDSRIALEPDWMSSNSGGVHIGLGVRRTLSGGNDIGVRLELDDIDSNTLLALRAFDYRFNRSERFAVSAFLGAARLDLATPAYGYYFGGGVQFKEMLAGWDLSVELRRGDKIARDNLLPTDPQGGSPDNFYDLTGLGVYLSKRF
jgi:hypothetical protein